MEIYNYSPLTGEYVVATQARPDPLDEGNFLIPANATTDAPPAFGDDEIPVWENGAWVVKPDFRGTKYWTVDGAFVVEGEVKEIGETVPDGAVLSDPGDRPSALHTWSGSAWIAPTEAEQVAAWRADAFLSRAQFFIAAWKAVLISKADAAKGARGETPQLMLDALAAAITAGDLTQAEADEAEIEFAGASRIERANPTVELMRVSLNLTPEQVDVLFGWTG